MSFEYMREGSRLSAETSRVGDSIYISAQPTHVPLNGMWIPNSDVPTVAAELLKAAGLDSIILPRGPIESLINKVLEDGLVDKFNEAEAEKKLQERRERRAELRKRLNFGHYGCKECVKGEIDALDYIINLEDGK